MIALRNATTIERRSRVNADLTGRNVAVGTLAPRELGHEYICLVLGDVPKGARVTEADIRAALEHMLTVLA